MEQFITSNTAYRVNVPCIAKDYLSASDEARKNAGSTLRRIIDRMSREEMIKVVFIPLVIADMAWIYAEKAVKEAAKNHVELLKQASRTVRTLRQRYEDDLNFDMTKRQVTNLRRDMAQRILPYVERDSTICYFTANQTLLNSKARDYPYIELRTYALMSYWFLRLYKTYIDETNKMLDERFGRTMTKTFIPVHLKLLKEIMEGFVGIGCYDLEVEDKQLVLAYKVIENRLSTMNVNI